MEYAFGGTKIGETQGGVCADDADQGNAVDIVTFGDHLGANEEINFAGVEASEKTFHVASSSNCVAIHATDSGVGEEFLEALLALL